MLRHKWVICICSCLVFVKFSFGLILKGELSTNNEDFKFLARFCFRKSLAKMKFHFEYPEEYCCQSILLYFDHQWKQVYPGFDKNCSMKEKVLVPDYHQKIELSHTFVHSGCHREVPPDSKSILKCGGRRSFLSVRARWWYIAVSNCKSTKGLRLNYDIELTNGDTFWTKHFSADELHILETDIVFLIVFFILLLLALVEAKMLASRKLFHYTYKLFLWSTFGEFLSLIAYTSYYTNYGLYGKPNMRVKVLGQAIHYIGHIVFLVMLILLAKGWTVTRGRISSSGQVKLAVFSTLYCISFVVLFIYERVIFDPGKVLYTYESPAGIGICILRIVAWIWFCYATFFTLKHFPKKTSFYYPFWLLYTFWFLAGPFMVIIAAYVIEDYQRERTVNGIEWAISLVAHGTFLILTRPAAANTNFPFHMRTCQIDTLQSNYTGESSYAYEPSQISNGYTTNTFSVFQVTGNRHEASSQNRHDRYSGNTYQNGTQQHIPMTTLNASNLETSTQNGPRNSPPPSYSN